MPIPAQKPTTTPIPVQLSESEFTEFILPHLSMPRRGPRCKLGYHLVFNLILRVLYTGMQWKSLPVPQAPGGTDAIHYTTVYKVFARWSDDGSLEQAFMASVGHLSAHNQLDLSILHGDGTNTVAKKGGDGIGYSGHKHQKGEKVRLFAKFEARPKSFHTKPLCAFDDCVHFEDHTPSAESA